MDLGSESVDSVEVKNNGSIANGIGNGPVTSANHVAPVVDLTHSPGKGQGLRKWKRIPRALGNEGGGNSVDDSSRKRVMSGLDTPVERSNNSEGSVNMMRNVGVGDGFGFGFGFGGSSVDSRYAAGPVFAARADSENSEDRSSKSSTAASGPKGRFDVPVPVRSSRVKSAGAKSWGNSAQSAQPGRGRSESSKKHRADRIKIDKENSHSSVESDSRSSNFVFTQPAALPSNGKQSRRSMSQEGENSDEAHASERQNSEEVQTGNRRENAVDVEDFSQDLDTDFPWEGKVDKKKKHGSFADMDALAESMFNFQTVQEALQKEVQLFMEIGKESISRDDNSLKPVDPSSSDAKIIESNLSDQLSSEKIGQSFSNSLEAQILSLKQHVKLMEGKLVETRARLEVKESRVVELEDIVKISKSFKEESGSTVELQEEQYRELEAEVESLFMQKIEAEVECIVLKTTTQKGKFAAAGQISLIEEQEAVVGEQAQILNKLGEAEIRAGKLKEQTEELGKYRGDVLGTGEVFTMQKKLCKVSSCFFVQLLLLVLAVWFFMLQSSPPQGVVVPT